MKHLLSLASLLLLCWTTTAMAQTIALTDLAAALRHGGYVIVMRHASSPVDAPDAAHADRENPMLERQLDARGRNEALAMGAALVRLHIPVGEVLSSPTYRARETARLLGLTNLRIAGELGNADMQAAGEKQAAWLKEETLKSVDEGNRLLITHGPNISAAFPEASQGMGEGDALIFDPRGATKPQVVQRLKMTDWPALH